MKPPTRVTVALDDETAERFEDMKEEMKISQSELIRRALRFYRDYKSIVDLGGEDTGLYVEMLHRVDTLPEDDPFWENCRAVAEAHAKQLSDHVFTPVTLLRRLEACNFFKIHDGCRREDFKDKGEGQ
jgi:hypothetical protein